ncbi:MAG: STAS domain-containing protein [Candidatus Sericytochromatia bacterium]
MQLEFAQEQGIAVLSLKGQISELSAFKLVQDVGSALATHDGFKTWVLDLSRMDMRDSTGLSAFIDSLQTILSQGKSVKLAALQPQCQTLLKISRVHYMIDFYPTLSAALGLKSQ